MLAVALAGALGAAARFAVDHVISTWRPAATPWGTAAVNISGSLGAGVVVGATGWGLEDAVRVVVVAGFFGSYTTFSTWMAETVRLLESGAPGRLPALANGLGSLTLGLVAAGAGLWLGALVG